MASPPPLLPAGAAAARMAPDRAALPNINTTLDYYANVDEAAMRAVLGPRRNTGPVQPPAGPTADQLDEPQAVGGNGAAD